MDFKWLLFDLGGVLVEYVGVQRMKELLPRPVTDEELARLWLYSPAVRAHESGKMSPDVFARDVIAELGLAIGPDEFLEQFPHYVTGYYPGAREMLSALAARHRLALLSNTNRVQWEEIRAHSDADRLFQKVFLSFETGHMKPDREAFIHVAETLGCAPHDILFFDDNPNNVQGARDTGLQAVHVRDFADLRETLVRMGVLSVFPTK